MIYKRVGSGIFPVVVDLEERKRRAAEVLQMHANEGQMPVFLTCLEAEVLEEALDLYLAKHAEGGQNNG
jgi:hypothetical protein